jgi:hypothetical protein
MKGIYESDKHFVSMNGDRHLSRNIDYISNQRFDLATSELETRTKEGIETKNIIAIKEVNGKKEVVFLQDELDKFFNGFKNDLNLADPVNERKLDFKIFDIASNEKAIPPNHKVKIN